MYHEAIIENKLFLHKQTDEQTNGRTDGKLIDKVGFMGVEQVLVSPDLSSFRPCAG
jgi:hypothetical protein